MPAQRRSLPYPSPPPPPPPPPTSEDEEDDPQNQDDDDDDHEEEEEEVQETEGAEEEQNQDDDADEEDGGDASEYDEFITVKLADLRKEVQCPICLGIIRKTRTVMECLHRFCRECIDKSMRLGNNECPACRTHCASRRSLRDDPNFDALIATLYSDIDEYEKEEFDLLEEEKNHNEKIQASIAETFQRQSEALGKRKSTATPTTAAFARKSQGSYRSFSLGQRGRGRSRDLDLSLAGSEDDEEEDANGNGVIEYSSSDEPSPDRRQKRPRRSATRSSVAHVPGNVGITHEKKSNVVETKRDNRGTPLQIGNGEILSWGGGGVRSQTRHGNSGSGGRLVKGGRTTKLVEYFSGLAKNDNEFDMHLALLPMDEQSATKLQRPYICCWPSLSIRHLCQFIALQTSVREEEVEILTRKPCTLLTNAEFNPSEELRVVGRQESMVELRHSCTNTRGDLVFMYRFKKPN